MTCPNCGGPVEQGGRGMGRVFCIPACQVAFKARQMSEGKAINALVKAWVATRHAPAGTREAAICAYARTELTKIAAIHNAEDAEKKRSAVDYVETLMRSGFMFVDRRRKPNRKPDQLV